MEGGLPPLNERGEAFAGFLWYDAPPADLEGPLSLQLDLLQPVGGAPLPPLPGLPPLPPLPADPLLLPLDGLGGGSADLQAPTGPQQMDAEAPAARGGRRRASEEERKARNRATQQRFRERQKAKNDALLHEHASTAAELERTRSEHQDLQAQNAVLQKLLNVRDSAIDVLGSAGTPGSTQPAQQAQQAQQQVQRQASGGSQSALQQQQSTSSSLDREASGGEIAGAASMTSTVARHMQRLQVELSAQLAQQLELPATAHPDEAMAVAVAKMPPPSPCKSPPGEPESLLALPPPLGTAAGAAAGGAGCCGAGAAVAVAAGAAAAAAGAAAAGAAGEERMEEVVPEPQPQHTQQAQHEDGQAGGDIATLVQQRPDLLQRVLAMGPADQIADWHTSARTFREILESHEATRSSAELERIVDILRERSVLFSMTLHFKPENAQALFATAANAPPELWPVVARSLAPTQAQRAMLQQLWHAFVSRVASIRAKRAAAVQAVRDAAQTTQAAAAVTPASLPASTLGGLMSQYLSLFDAAGHLSSLRDAEFIAMLQLMGRTGAVFSPVQKARVAAASFPYFPDVVQLVRILAEEGQHPPTAAAATAAADSSSSASVSGGGTSGGGAECGPGQQAAQPPA